MSISDTLEKLNVHPSHLELGVDRYRSFIRSTCVNKLETIKITEKIIRGSDLVLAVNYLLKHATPDNVDTLQYLLDPRRTSRG
jgi:hypothetical protein